MTPENIDLGYDEQDQAEVLDEDNLSPDDMGAPSAELRTFEDIPDVLDTTQAVGDDDDDAAAIAEELDDDEIIELSEDGDATDIEDDDLALRDGEAFGDDSGQPLDAADPLLDEELGLDAEDRQLTQSSDDEVSLVYAGDATNFAVGQARPRALEAERLADDDIAVLGYDDKGDDGKPGAPVRFDIRLQGSLWVVERDGERIHDYSHLDRATRETNALARGLRSTGQPAEVYVTASEDKTIQIVDETQPSRSPEEESAVVPDRSDSA
jgi:hypothetical protein